MSQENTYKILEQITDFWADLQESPKLSRVDRMILETFIDISKMPDIQAILDEATKKKLDALPLYLDKPTLLEEEEANFYSLFGRSANNRYLTNLIDRVNTNLDYEAICIIQSSAHGYSIEYEIIQTKEYCCLKHTKTDFGEGTCDLKLNLDLIKELHNLRQEQPILRVSLPPDPNGGRCSTIFIATKEGGEWITGQRPLIGQVYEDNAMNRIYLAI